MTEAPRLVRPQLLRADARRPGRRPVQWTRASPWCSPSWAADPSRTWPHEWDIESSLLHRWVGDFLVAGSGAITNRPDPDEARQRDRFMAALAHELRTPMAVARGWAMTLAEGGLPEDRSPTRSSGC